MSNAGRLESTDPPKFYDVTIEMLVRQQHPQYGINTRLMRKVNGHWVIALNHVSSSETAPTEAIETTKQRH